LISAGLPDIFRQLKYSAGENKVAFKRSAARAASYQLAIIGKVIWKIGPDVYRIRSLSALIKRITARCRDEIALRAHRRRTPVGPLIRFNRARVPQRAQDSGRL